LIKKQIDQFDRHASEYTELNIIQKEVALELVSKLNTKEKKMIDIGCGSGEIFRLCRESCRFVAVDKSIKMLSLHEKSAKTELIHADFDLDILESFEENEFDIAISSSALQWSDDINKALKRIQKISKQQAVAVFCSDTFKTIKQVARIENFLPESVEICKMLQSLEFDDIRVRNYKLHFDNNLEAFRYIKKSGVSGGKKILEYKQTKELIEKYPLDYLEFEVILGWKNAPQNQCKILD
jgi:malonyl-CoA O-methyltransferase